MTLSVKTNLIRNSGKTEIRRFIMEEDFKGRSLQAIWEKINKLYGDNLQERGFALFWKDDDDDDIVMTSDEELVAAIKAQKSDVLKLIIQKPKHCRRSSKQEASSEVHQGVTCDGCEGGVCGMRYKCLQCHDYDLCSSCEHKNIHPEHLMIRIPTSNAFGNGFPGFPYWMLGGHRGRHGCGWRRMHRFHQAHQKESSQQNGDQAFHPGEFLERVWRVVGNFVPQAGARPTPQESANENQQDTNTTIPTPNEYLQSVGQSVAAMLDPLGIDVTIDVEHDGERKRCGMPRQDSNQPSASGSDEKMKQPSSGDDKPPSDAKDEEKTPTDSLPEASSSSDTVKQFNPSESAREYISQLTQVLSGLSMSRGDSLSSDPQNHADGEWTCINYECDEEQDRNKSPPQNTDVKTVVESDAATASAPSAPSHSDPVIAVAVDQMTSMGYDNENNWLITLLELNNGNVDQTLEQIHSLPNNQEKMMEFINSYLHKNSGNYDGLIQVLQSIRKYANTR